MRRIPRPGSWIVGLLLLGLTVGWLCYVPYSSERLLAAIPHNAQFLSAHQRPALRWASIAASPATRSLLSSVGVEPDRLDELTMDAGLREVLQKVNPREVVCAFVPELGVHSEPAWVGVAWIGAWSHALRWLAPWVDLRDAKRQRVTGNRVVWTLPFPALGDENKLFVSFEEGMIFACVARSTDSMLAVLHCFDGHSPSVASLFRDQQPVLWPLRSDVQDRGWMCVATQKEGPGRLDRWLFEVTELNRDTLVGRVLIPADGVDGTPLVRAEMDRAQMGRCLGDLPQGGLLLPWQRVVWWLHRWDTPWLDTLHHAVAELDLDQLGLFLLGGEYSGRLRGVKIPACVLVLPVSNPEIAPDRVSAYLDQINGDFQLGLFPAEEYVGDRKLFSVATSVRGAYGDLADEERIAYAVLDEMLLVATSVEPLRKLVARYDWQTALDEQEFGPWNVADVASGTLWFDLAEGLETVRKGMFAYTVMLMAKDTDRSQAHFEHVRDAKAWLQALAPLQEIYVVANNEKDGWTELKVRCGTP